MSLALYYQMIGRGIRPHPGKDKSVIMDLCGNTGMFGKVEDLVLWPGENGKWIIMSNGRQLTNIYYGERPMVGRG
jgi:DNA repair protein RadD